MKHILKLAYASHPDFYTHARVIPRVVDKRPGTPQELTPNEHSLYHVFLVETAQERWLASAFWSLVVKVLLFQGRRPWRCS